MAAIHLPLAHTTDPYDLYTTSNSGSFFHNPINHSTTITSTYPVYPPGYINLQPSLLGAAQTPNPYAYDTAYFFDAAERVHYLRFMPKPVYLTNPYINPSTSTTFTTTTTTLHPFSAPHTYPTSPTTHFTQPTQSNTLYNTQSNRHLAPMPPVETLEQACARTCPIHLRLHLIYHSNTTTRDPKTGYDIPAAPFPYTVDEVTFINPQEIEKAISSAYSSTFSYLHLTTTVTLLHNAHVLKAQWRMGLLEWENVAVDGVSSWSAARAMQAGDTLTFTLSLDPADLIGRYPRDTPGGMCEVWM